MTKKWIKKAPEKAPDKKAEKSELPKKPSATAMRGKMYGKE